jgi:hypothetical protein
LSASAISSRGGEAREAQFEDGARLRLGEANGAVGVERVARIESNVRFDGHPRAVFAPFF